MEEEFARKRRAMYSDESMTEFREGFGQGNREMRSKEFGRWADSISGMAIDELRDMLAQANAVLAQTGSADTAADSNSAESLDEYSESAAKARAAVQLLTEAIEDYEKKQKDADGDTEKSSANWTELMGVIRSASSVFTELGNTIGGTTGMLLTSIGTIADSCISIATGIEAVTTAASALDKASAILAVISALLKAVTFAIQYQFDESEAITEANRATMEYTNSIKELTEAKRLAASETIFGTDELEQLNSYNDIISDRLSDIKEAYDEFRRRNDIFAHLVMGVNFNVDISSDVEDTKLDLERVVSDMRTDWQVFWDTGRDQVFSFDLDTLFDEAGNIDFDVYNDFLEWYDSYSEGISDDTKVFIDNLIAQVDAYKEALDGIKEFASSLFGDVASDIADAILSGTGNLEAEMDDILFNIKQKVTKAMLENMILTDIFNEDLQNAIIDALKNGDVYLANNLFSQGMDELRNLLPEYKEFAESIGAVDASGSSSSTENTALSSVSQESFDMYSGRVANIQTHVIAIDRGVTSIVANSAMTVNLLTDISNDTARLLSIQKAVESTQSYISEIVLKGIKIR